MRAYYLRLAKTAFSRSIGPIDLWTGLVVALLGLVDHYWPQGELMMTYGWEIPIWALAAVMLVRISLAPFWMSAEDTAKIETLSNALDNKRARQAALNDLWKLRRKGVELRNQHIELAGIPDWENDFKVWQSEVFAAAEIASVHLRNHLEILNEVSRPPDNVNPVSKYHFRLLSHMSEMLRRMEKYLERDL